MLLIIGLREGGKHGRQAQRERGRQPASEQPAEQTEKCIRQRQGKKKETLLFATENGRVVINNLHLILGEVEPYRKVIA